MLSDSRERDGGAGAEAPTKEEEPSATGKAPGIPSCSVDAGAGAEDSGTTPPSRLPEPANPLRGVET
jgi:hypothetical protein